MGDPRAGKIDMVDWIEMIPLRETRNYVQRIMEGVGVYRDRLNGSFRTVPPGLGRSVAGTSAAGDPPQGRLRQRALVHGRRRLLELVERRVADQHGRHRWDGR